MGTCPPKAPHCPYPESSMRIIRTLGAPLGGFTSAILSGLESLYVVPITPLNGGAGYGRTYPPPLRSLAVWDCAKELNKHTRKKEAARKGIGPNFFTGVNLLKSIGQFLRNILAVGVSAVIRPADMTKGFQATWAERKLIAPTTGDKRQFTHRNQICNAKSASADLPGITLPYNRPSRTSGTLNASEVGILETCASAVGVCDMVHNPLEQVCAAVAHGPPALLR